LWEELTQLYESKELSEEQNTRIIEIEKEFKQLMWEKHAANTLLGAATGELKTEATKEGLSFLAGLMRDQMIKSSELFDGIVDETGYVLSNKSGKSIGVRWDGKKIGGTRIDLDVICGKNNENCLKDPNDPKGGLLRDENNMVIFTGSNKNKTLSDFLYLKDENGKAEGEKAIGFTGGIQGDKGTLSGNSYSAGSREDKLIEAFAGTHDMIGGQLSGLYDKEGNARRNRPKVVEVAHEIWSGIAILPSTPFALSELLSSKTWNAIDSIFKATK